MKTFLAASIPDEEEQCTIEFVLVTVTNPEKRLFSGLGKYLHKSLSKLA